MSFYIGLSVLSNIVKGTARAKAASAEARRILSALSGRDITENILELEREENGRPFFPGHEVDFSISHSEAMAAVSLTTEKNIRTGCDIELIRPRPAAEKIAAAFFHPAEREFIDGKFFEGSFGGSRGRLCAEVNIDSINSSNNNCLYDNGSRDQDKNSFRLKRFYSLWVLKECYLKLKGLSVFDMRAAPCFIGTESPGGKGLGRGRVLDKTAGGALSFFLYKLSAGGEDYMLAAAVEGSVRSPPEIRRYGFTGESDILYKRVMLTL